MSTAGGSADRIDLGRVIENSWLERGTHFTSLESTNSYALQNPAVWRELPAIILAEQQTAGRGRGKNSWHAGSGALTFSLLVDPQRFGIPQAKWPRLSVTVGLAIATELSNRVPDSPVHLKWPNDVYLCDRKVCGILIEAASHSSGLVIGIGLNINNSLAGSPPEVQARAISVCDLLEHPLDRTDFLIGLLRQLERDFTALAEDDPQLVARWQSRCWLTGKIVTIQAGPEQVTGLCQGMDETAALWLQTDRGQRSFIGGVIESVS